MCILTIPLIFLNWIRNLKLLVPVSMVANVLQMSSIVVVFYYIFRDRLPPINSVPAFGSWGGLPLFFGTAIFSLETITLVLPLQKDMRRPWDFKGWTGILNTGMSIVTCIYIAMGFFGIIGLNYWSFEYWAWNVILVSAGYLRYGEDIQGSITLNLPEDEAWVHLEIVRQHFDSSILFSFGRLAQVVKILLVIAICGNYAV